MESSSSSSHETRQVQFDKHLLCLLEQEENDEAKTLIQKNPDYLKSVDSNGCTLLHYAAKYKNANMVSYLIDSRVDVNVQDNQGRTALMAISLDSVDPTMTLILFEAGAYVHLRDVNDESGFRMIMKKDFVDPSIAKFCVRNLIDYCPNDNDELIKLLLECKDPLRHVILAKNPMLTRSLLQQGYPVNTKLDPCGGTAMHVAVPRHDLDQVKILIEYGADVNVENYNGMSPLAIFDAFFWPSDETFEILRILLDRGALAASRHGLRRLPITSVLHRGKRRDIRLLRQYKLNLHARDDYRRTPLHIMADNQCENIFEEFEGMDFKVNARDHEKRTPLHCVTGNKSTVKFLVKHGANVNARDKSGLTPLHYAFTLSKRIGIACDDRYIEIFLESGANPLAVSIDGTTVVQEAVDNQEFIAIEPVLAHLALLKVRGTVIKKRIRKQIARDSRLKDAYNFCVKKSTQLETAKIWESMTLCDLLMESEEKLAVYMRNAELVLKLTRIDIKYKKHLNYYHHFIRRRVQKILRKAQVKGRAAVVIWKLMKLQYETNPIVLDAIVSYLDEKDLLNLLQL